MEGNWLQDLFTRGLEQIELGVNKLYLLAQTIDTIQFTEHTWIYSFVGLIRYILGDPLFIAIAVFFDIGIGFVMYKVIKKIINIITSLIPGLKGKVIIP